MNSETHSSVRSAAAPRLIPISLPDWGEPERDALRAGMPARLVESFLSSGPDAVPVSNVLATLVHHPSLAGPFLAFNRTLMTSDVLDQRLRELMVLRVAWRTRSAYEWAQHTRLAVRCAITEEELAAISLGADATGWSPLEAALLRATDQLMDNYQVDEATWARLVVEFTERQLMEVVFVVGCYTCLAMVFNGLEIQLDPGLEPVIPLSNDAARTAISEVAS